MRGGARNLFLSFLDFLIRYLFETNLCLSVIFQKNLVPLRTLAASGIALFVTLVNVFQSWDNVRKVSVLDIVQVLDTSLYSVYKLL